MPAGPSPAAGGPIAAQAAGSSVYSGLRTVEQPLIELPPRLRRGERLEMDGRELLAALPDDAVAAAFFDPQYRGVLDRLAYGNEGERRGRRRAELVQMGEDIIAEFVREIARVLIASGHLFLWIDKFHLMTGFRDWLDGTELDVVDMVTWDKGKIGMGYRTRRRAEYLVVLQKAPRRAKGVWKLHDIPDVWQEAIPKDRRAAGVHPKPIQLQARLIEAVTNPGDLVLDPAAGTYSVLEACGQTNRAFLGCDLNG